jgi:hypothetical protein
MSVASSLLPSYANRVGLGIPFFFLAFFSGRARILSRFLLPAGENSNPMEYFIFPPLLLNKQPAFYFYFAFFLIFRRAKL